MGVSCLSERAVIIVYSNDCSHSIFILFRNIYSKKCDGFMVAPTKTDKKLGTINIPHEGPEEYDNIWQKVRSMWSYVYDNFYEKVSQLKCIDLSMIGFTSAAMICILS